MFSFFQDVLSGIITFVISSILGSVSLLILRNYLRDRFETWLQSAISDYIRTQLEYSIQHSEETARALAPIINALIKEALKNIEKTNKPQMVNLLGFKLPADLVQMLISRFVSGNTSRKETNNPFA